jgi:hypothetical protein
VVDQPLTSRSHSSLFDVISGPNQQNHPSALVAVGDDPGQPPGSQFRLELLHSGAPAQCRFRNVSQERAEMRTGGGFSAGQFPYYAAVEVAASGDAVRVGQPCGKQFTRDRFQTVQDVVDHRSRGDGISRRPVSNDDGCIGGQRIQADCQLLVGETSQPDHLGGRDLRQRQRLPTCHCAHPALTPTLRAVGRLPPFSPTSCEASGRRPGCLLTSP